MNAQEIIARIKELAPRERNEVIRWLWAQAEDTPEMLEFIDEGVHSLKHEPKTSADEILQKIRKWSIG